MGLVLLGTTTVHGRPKAFDAVTAARPAFPPEEEKKWILSGLEDCCRVERMKAPMPRDLKEPEGWRRSSLRKILLLRFSDLCLNCIYWAKGCSEVVPSSCFRKVGGLDERSLAPGLGLIMDLGVTRHDG